MTDDVMSAAEVRYMLEVIAEWFDDPTEGPNVAVERSWPTPITLTPGYLIRRIVDALDAAEETDDE